MNLRRERKIRDDYHELLSGYNTRGTIISTSTWAETFTQFRQDSRFLKMLEQPGSTPLDVFKFYVEDLKKRYSKDKKRIRDVLKQSKRKVTVETSYDEYERWLSVEDAINQLGVGNAALCFRSLVEKAAEKSSEKTAEKPSSHRSKRDRSRDAPKAKKAKKSRKSHDD